MVQLKPNKTQITATITQVLDDGQFFKIVILTLPEKPTLPAFLWVGKSLQAKNQSTNVAFAQGDIISAAIEVMGDPFKQSYFLHSIAKIADAERSNL